MPIEPSNVIAALAAATHATNILRGITSAIQATGKAEVISQLIDLQSAMMEVQQKQAELFTENLMLKDEISALKKAARVKAELKFTFGVYHRDLDGTAHHYCTKCYDVNEKLVNLQDAREFGHQFRCPNCHAYYG